MHYTGIELVTSISAANSEALSSTHQLRFNFPELHRAPRTQIPRAAKRFVILTSYIYVIQDQKIATVNIQTHSGQCPIYTRYESRFSRLYTTPSWAVYTDSSSSDDELDLCDDYSAVAGIPGTSPSMRT